MSNRDAEYIGYLFSMGFAFMAVILRVFTDNNDAAVWILLLAIFDLVLAERFARLADKEEK